MSFFDSTPVGRLLHRLSYDTEVVDIVLTQKATNVLVSSGWGIAGIAVMTAISQGIMLLFIIPTLFAVYQVQLFYRRSAVDLQRLDATTRSPLQSLLVEGLEGASTIKAYDVQPYFLQNLRSALDENTIALLCWTTAQRYVLKAVSRLSACCVMLYCLELSHFLLHLYLKKKTHTHTHTYTWQKKDGLD
jgi:ABC-type bacteriocin/lantibiotic exporter with double-glycine peptidase domain